MTKRMKRLKWCKKLYGGDIRKVGRIYISKNRRYFYIYYKDSIPCYQKEVIYARYKVEKRLGHKLSKKYDVHHKDENTLNDKYNNLKVKKHNHHVSRHKVGKNHPLFGKHLSEETKRKLRNAAYLRDVTDYRRFKLRKVV